MFFSWVYNTMGRIIFIQRRIIYRRITTHCVVCDVFINYNTFAVCEFHGVYANLAKITVIMMMPVANRIIASTAINNIFVWLMYYCIYIEILQLRWKMMVAWIDCQIFINNNFFFTNVIRVLLDIVKNFYFISYFHTYYITHDEYY